MKKMTEVNCPICSNNSFEVFYGFDDFKICKCKECEMIYLNPRYTSSAIEEFYNETYYGRENSTVGGYQSYESQQADLTLTYLKFYKEVLPYVKQKKRVLDIGCGFGYFLSNTTKDFNESVGLDVSEQACIELRKKGLGAINSNVEKISPLEVGKFDLIVMTDFIEHVYDLNIFMLKLKDICNPDAILLIVTPNYNSWLRIFSGRNWVSFKIPEHVNYFTPKTLEQFLEKYSFEVINCKQTGQFASIKFVTDRIRKIHKILAYAFILFTNILGLKYKSMFFPNGNMYTICRFKS
jgi:2-polyprenyl-3-methyl-5-hydroxy-6-metoxy-1,4-benzoquinol methylase